jgi:hypothetical protein
MRQSFERIALLSVQRPATSGGLGTAADKYRPSYDYGRWPTQRAPGVH